MPNEEYSRYKQTLPHSSHSAHLGSFEPDPTGTAAANCGADVGVAGTDAEALAVIRLPPLHARTLPLTSLEKPDGPHPLHRRTELGPLLL